MFTDSAETAEDFAIIGAISLALTILNIVCIWVSGIVMFEIKEVAPAKEKNAFWAKDIKIARELNTEAKAGEKPRPVNFSIIRKGAKTALTRRESGGEKTPSTISEVRIRPPSPKSRPYDRPSINAAFALHPSRSKIHTSASPVFTTRRRMSTIDEKEEDDDVRYVGLEDMGTLLGFDVDSDDEESVDPAAVAKKLGHGRYI